MHNFSFALSASLNEFRLPLKRKLIKIIRSNAAAAGPVVLQEEEKMENGLEWVWKKQEK